ncbi:hypothetical protein QQP08_014572, partial [Theobroma cacao]
SYPFFSIVEFDESSTQSESLYLQFLRAKTDTSREMIEITDYKDPRPNINPKTGCIFSPPPQG